MDEEHYHHRRVDVSPLFVGVIGVMAGAMVVATFHCIVVGWCNARSQTTAPPIQRRIVRTNNNQQDTPSTTSTSTNRTTNASTSSSTSNSLLQLMAVYRYSKEFQEGTCAVCLSEFKEGDEVRILPECAHLFHVPCIDMWLYSHPNCPLCRTNTTPPPPQPLPLPPPPPSHLPPPPPPPLRVGMSLPDSSGVLSPES